MKKGKKEKIIEALKNQKMVVEITPTDEFECEICGQDTEFKGYYNHTLRKLCPYCATEEVVEIVNHS